MKIAIIDTMNQDIGIKILFPEADYYVINDEVNKDASLRHYNIHKRYDIENVNDVNYDYLFIIIALYDTYKGSSYFKENVYNGLQKILEIVNKNNFKKVFLFDNYDYDYDPNDYLQNDKINLYFKRNYSKNKAYNDNVIPFTFIMFGYWSMIEIIDSKKRPLVPNPVPRLYFSGNIFNHIDNEYKCFRSRQKFYDEFKHLIFNPGHTDRETFLNIINTSKFSLDLNGAGDPNMRTFEILSQGSLRIAEYNHLKWCFNEEFSEETIFHDSNDFKTKLEKLVNDEELYQRCLNRQNELFEKYFNVKWLRSYIEGYLNNSENNLINSCINTE